MFKYSYLYTYHLHLFHFIIQIIHTTFGGTRWKCQMTHVIQFFFLLTYRDSLGLVSGESLWHSITHFSIQNAQTSDNTDESRVLLILVLSWPHPSSIFRPITQCHEPDTSSVYSTARRCWRCHLHLTPLGSHRATRQVWQRTHFVSFSYCIFTKKITWRVLI